MKNLGLKTSEIFTYNNIEEIIEKCNYWSEYRQELPFEIDGWSSR